MAKPQLAELSIRRKPNGGHTVTHRFKGAPKYTAGKAGGLTMDQAQPVEHQFAPDEHNQLLSHIASALALKGLDQKE